MTLLALDPPPTIVASWSSQPKDGFQDKAFSVSLDRLADARRGTSGVEACSKRMTDARTVFQDALAEISALSYPCDERFSFRFSVEYLRKDLNCYQFRSRSCSGLVQIDGHRIDVSGGIITRLPGALAVAVIDAFEDNAVIAFYRGRNVRLGRITSELSTQFATIPEVLLVEIITQQDADGPMPSSLTRIALAGFEAGALGSPAANGLGALEEDDVVHPYWCRDRYIAL